MLLSDYGYGGVLTPGCKSGTSFAFGSQDNRYLDRLKILMDEPILLPPVVNNKGPYYSDSPPGAGWGPFYIEKAVDLRGLRTTFVASTGNYTDLATGALWWFCLPVVNSPAFGVKGMFALDYAS